MKIYFSDMNEQFYTKFEGKIYWLYSESMADAITEAEDLEYQRSEQFASNWDHVYGSDYVNGYNY